MPRLEDYADEEIKFSDQFEEFHIQTTEDKEEKTAEANTETAPQVESEVLAEPAKESSTSFLFDLDDFKDDKIFKTMEVANLCGLDPQIVRNRAAAWNPILELEKGSNGVTLWTKEKVLKFQELNMVKEDRHMTVNDVLELYTTAPEVKDEDHSPLLPADLENRMNSMLDAMSKRIVDTVKDQMEHMNERMEFYNTQLIEVKENKSTEQTMQEVLSIVQSMQKRDMEREKELKALRDENAELKERIEQELPKKKPKLFGLFGSN